MEALQKVDDSQDIEQVRKTAHTIKGVAANISGMKLQKAASDLETMTKEALAKNGQLESDGHSLRVISEAYADLRNLLQEYEPE